jgi:hypothetical protein
MRSPLAIAIATIVAVFLATSTRVALADRADEFVAHVNSQPLHSAIVQSTTTGFINWRYSELTSTDAAEKAMADCRRKSTRCTLVYLDRKLKRRIQRTLKIPAQFEVFDGVTKRTSRLAGTIAVLDAYSSNSISRIVVTAKSGKRLCIGESSITRAANGEFELLCFETIFKGTWAGGQLEFTLRKNQSYITAKLQP